MSDTHPTPAVTRGAARAEWIPRLVAWEVTRACVLNCRHCRAARTDGARADGAGAGPASASDELTSREAQLLLDNIASFARPIIILTGGEPMLRADVYEIASYASSLGLPVAMATCGVLLDDASVARIRESGVRRISVSIDGATSQSHDSFRQSPGSFQSCINGLDAARKGRLDFQVNTTVSRLNAGELPAILDLAISLGASTWNPFLLVPTGRGASLAADQMNAAEYERALTWLAGQESRSGIRIRVTCAPHYHRVLHQLGQSDPSDHSPSGCLGGKSFAFISHTGKVQICGFLDVECGDLRREGLDFRKVWTDSPVLTAVRDVSSYHGRCGACEYNRVCGGCRARAFAATGDYLAEEPLCSHEPRQARTSAAESGAALDPVYATLLSALQLRLPIAQRPFDVMARELSLPPEEVISRVAHLKAADLIRRLGAVFDAGRLGYASTLVAAKVPPDRVDDIAARVSRLPGVTHNYLRDGDYNLWFTLTAPSADEIERILKDLKTASSIAAFHSLPALAMYKRRVFFDVAGDSPESAPLAPSAPSAPLDSTGQALVRALQDDLPTTPEPFAAVAQAAGMSVDDVLSRVNAWLASGVIRRFGAVVAHRALGYSANGMAVFAVPDSEVEAAGALLAAQTEVSHCYRRPPVPDWPYSLYAMVHGKSCDEVNAVVNVAARKLRVADYRVLFSTREFKKTSMRYFIE